MTEGRWQPTSNLKWNENGVLVQLWKEKTSGTYRWREVEMAHPTRPDRSMACRRWKAGAVSITVLGTILEMEKDGTLIRAQLTQEQAEDLARGLALRE